MTKMMMTEEDGGNVVHQNKRRRQHIQCFSDSKNQNNADPSFDKVSRAVRARAATPGRLRKLIFPSMI